ncbi:hypothetical protein Plhal304r1_c049g0131041 [Plasmopara halstedii]
MTTWGSSSAPHRGATTPPTVWDGHNVWRSCRWVAKYFLFSRLSSVGVQIRAEVSGQGSKMISFVKQLEDLAEYSLKTSVQEPRLF